MDPESFLITDFSEETRRQFFDYLRDIHLVVLAEDLALVDQSDRHTIAWVTYLYRSNQFGIWIKKISVLMNEAAFLLDGEDNRDLMPITLEHEITEAWVDIMERKQRGRALKTRSARTTAGHQAGRLAEYRLAHQMGVADRYLEQARKWAKLDPPHWRKVFWQENLEAYLITKPENLTDGLR